MNANTSRLVLIAIGLATALFAQPARTAEISPIPQWAGWYRDSLLFVVGYGKDEFLQRTADDDPLPISNGFLISVHILDFGPSSLLPWTAATGQSLGSPTLPRKGGSFEPDHLKVEIGGVDCISEGRCANILNRLPYFATLGEADTVSMWKAIKSDGTFRANRYTMYPVLTTRPDEPPSLIYAGKPIMTVSFTNIMDTFSWANSPEDIGANVPELARDLPTKGYLYVEQPDNLNPGYDLTILERQVSMFPQDPQPYLHRGDAYLGTMQYEKALNDYSKLIQLSPSSPVGWSRRASLYQQCGLPKSALRDVLAAQSRDVEKDRYEFMIKSLSDKIRETDLSFSMDDYLPTKPLRRTR